MNVNIFQARTLAEAQEQVESSQRVLTEKEQEVERMNEELVTAQREREEKEAALMEAMANIHVKEHEAEENDVGENNEDFSKLDSVNRRADDTASINFNLLMSWHSKKICINDDFPIIVAFPMTKLVSKINSEL